VEFSESIALQWGEIQSSSICAVEFKRARAIWYMKQSNCAVEFKRARAIWYTQQQAQQRTGSRARTQTRGARREGGQLARLGVGAGARRQTWGRVWWQAAHGWMVRSVSPLVGSGDGPPVHHPRS
jgi:hypothetical protein